MRRVDLPVRDPRMAVVVGSDLFVTSYADNRVVRMPWPACDRVTGVLRVRRPRGVVLLDGLLYVACYGNPIGRVVAFRPETMTVSHRFRAFRPRGIAHWNGNVLVSEVNRGRIAAYGPRGGLRRTWTGFKEPRDVCVHGDAMLVADTGRNRVVLVSLSDAAPATTILRMHRPNGVATNGRDVVATEWHSGRVVTARGHSFIAMTPTMVACSQNVVTVCDAGLNCVYVLSIRSVSSRRRSLSPRTSRTRETRCEHAPRTSSRSRPRAPLAS